MFYYPTFPLAQEISFGTQHRLQSTDTRGHLLLLEAHEESVSRRYYHPASCPLLSFSFADLALSADCGGRNDGSGADVDVDEAAAAAAGCESQHDPGESAVAAAGQEGQHDADKSAVAAVGHESQDGAGRPAAAAVEHESQHDSDKPAAAAVVLVALDSERERESQDDHPLH